MQNNLTAYQISKVVDIYRTRSTKTRSRDARRFLMRETGRHFTIDEIQEIVGDDSLKLRTSKRPNPYEVIGSDYVFKTDTATYRINVSTADAIFRDYSSRGGNLSSEDIINKYGLLPEFWNVFKGRLRLFKSSHAISPHTLDSSTPEQVEEIIQGVVDDSIKDRYNDTFVRKYEEAKWKDYKAKSQRLASLDSFLDSFSQYLEGYSPHRDYSDDVDTKVDSGQKITAFISDLHIGKANTKGVLDRLKSTSTYLASIPQNDVTVICLGDIYETVAQDGMHPGQLSTMDITDTFDTMMLATETLVEFINTIRSSGKTVRFIGLPGNHDRFTKMKEDDKRLVAGLVTYELVRRSFSDSVVSYFREKWNTFDNDGVRFILHHGDDGATKRNASQILWELGDKSKYNVIAMGDKHHLSMKDSHDDATHIIVPSLAGKNQYDKDLLLSSSAGFVTVHRSSLGVTTTTHRL